MFVSKNPPIGIREVEGIKQVWRQSNRTNPHSGGANAH
jgi:hypothetical protein